MGHVSEKTDAFSYGIVLIELVTNLPAFEARSLVEFMTTSVSASVVSHETVGAIGWQSAELDFLALAIERLTESRVHPRSSVSQEIGELEALTMRLL